MLDYQIGLMAEQILDLDPYGARDADATKETVKYELLNDPLSIISYLLEYIEDMQE